MKNPLCSEEADFWYRTSKEKKIIDQIIEELNFKNNKLAFGPDHPRFVDPDMDEIFCNSKLYNFTQRKT